MTDSLNELIALNPRGETFRREVLTDFHKAPTQQTLWGVQTIEDRTAMLCELFGHVLPTRSTYVRSIVQNDLFTSVAIWLQILGSHFRATDRNDEFKCAELLTDILTTMSGRAEVLVERIVTLMIAAYLVSAALHDVYERRPLLGSVTLEVVVASDLYASLRRCASVDEIIHEVRSQLTSASVST
jgi:hypothetical protein